MNEINIKESRKKLGLTQDELAKQLGVSRRTIQNYEKGEVIPETKREILFKSLKINLPNNFNEPEPDYLILTGYDERILQIEENIKAREQIITLAGKNEFLINHQKEMIKLLKLQLEMIKQPIKNEQNEK